MLTFHIITLFPEVISAYAGASILGRAQMEKKIKVKTYTPRDFSGGDIYVRVDGKPYGGGPGMVMQALPILKAVAKARGKKKNVKAYILSPQGKQFTNAMAKMIAEKYTDVILVAGRYEGIDARVKKILRAEEISTGPYVLTGGELPALAIVDATARQIDGVLGKDESREETRAASAEVYTRPEVLAYAGKKYKVPKILLSGHHKNIEAWREKRDVRKNNGGL